MKYDKIISFGTNYWLSCSFVNVKISLSKHCLLWDDDFLVIEQCPGTVFPDVHDVMTTVNWFTQMDNDCFQVVKRVIVSLSSFLLLSLRLLWLQTVHKLTHVTSKGEKPFDGFGDASLLKLFIKNTFWMSAILACKSSNPISWIWRIEFSSTFGPDWLLDFSSSNGASMLLSKLSMIQLIAASMLSFVAFKALILAFLEYPIPSSMARLSSEYSFFFYSFIYGPGTGFAFLNKNSDKSSFSGICKRAFSFLGTHFSRMNLFAIAIKYFGVVLK